MHIVVVHSLVNNVDFFPILLNIYTFAHHLCL